MKQDAQPERARRSASMLLALPKNWGLFCLAILLFKLVLLAIDPLPRLHPGESLSYLRTAVTGSISEDLLYFYGFVVRCLCNGSASLNSLLIIQALFGAGIAIAVAWICRAFFSLSTSLCYLFGFLCCLDPLRLCWERYIVPDTFSMFLYALVLWQSFVYLRERRIRTLLIIQVLSIITIAFGSILLIPLQMLALVLPLIGCACGEVRTEAASTDHAVWLQLLRSSRFWLHLAVSTIAMLLLGQAYKQVNGFLAHREPAYLHGKGYSLLAAWAPAIRPQDSADPRLAEIIRHGNEFDLSNHALRNAQRYAAGRLIDRWRRIEKDTQVAENLAMRTALNALARDAGGIVALAAQTYYAFWKGVTMERLANADLGAGRTGAGFERPLAERYHWQGQTDTETVPNILLRWYYVAAVPYYFAILLSPLLSLTLLLKTRNKAYAILLFAHTSLVFLVTFLFSLAPTIRSFQPLSLLMLLSAGLGIKSLYESAPMDIAAGQPSSVTAARAVDQRRQFFTVLGAISVAAMLRIGLAGNQPLWNDEIFSLAMTTGHSLEQPPAITNPVLGDFVLPQNPTSTDELRGYLSHDHPPAGLRRVIRAVFLSDTSPPLYYILLYYWTLAFGTSDFVLRQFSTICALACLPLVAGIARRTAGNQAVLPACLLFAFSPLGICFSTEARMYALLWLCVVVVTWLSLVWRANGTGTVLPAAWVGVSAAGFLTHYFFVFPWFALVVFVFLRPQRIQRTKFAACVFISGLIVSPWYIRVPESLRGWRLMKDWLRWEPDGFSRPRAIIDLVLQNFSGAGHHASSNFVALVIFAIIAAAMAIRLRSRMFAGQRLILWLLLVAPCSGLLLFDLIMHTYTLAHDRYAIAALPIACVLAAAGLRSLPNPTGTLLLILVLVAWMPNLLIYQQTGKRLAAAHRATAVSANSATDLVIIDAIPSGLLNVVRYLYSPAPIVGWMPAWLQDSAAREPPDKILQIAAGRTRVWWVGAAGSPPHAPEKDWLREHALVLHETNISAEFAPKDAATF